MNFIVNQNQIKSHDRQAGWILGNHFARNHDTQVLLNGFPLMIKSLGLQPYLSVWQAMQLFTAKRTVNTSDELWLLEHDAIYTQGLAGRPEHVINPGSIPILRTDRGGQVTYHGPGQLLAYLLLDLKRHRLGVRELVQRLEQSVIDVLRDYYQISAHRQPNAPGVYVQQAKIAALGLRIRDHCCYHGLAFNINMDLDPFAHIHPCGYAGMRVTQLADFGFTDETPTTIASRLSGMMINNLINI